MIFNCVYTESGSGGSSGSGEHQEYLSLKVDAEINTKWNLNNDNLFDGNSVNLSYTCAEMTKIVFDGWNYPNFRISVVTWHDSHGIGDDDYETGTDYLTCTGIQSGTTYTNITPPGSGYSQIHRSKYMSGNKSNAYFYIGVSRSAVKWYMMLDVNSQQDYCIAYISSSDIKFTIYYKS